MYSGELSSYKLYLADLERLKVMRQEKVIVSAKYLQILKEMNEEYQFSCFVYGLVRDAEYNYNPDNHVEVSEEWHKRIDEGWERHNKSTKYDRLDCFSVSTIKKDKKIFICFRTQGCASIADQCRYKGIKF